MPQKPIAILYEHPEWFKLLFVELDRRRIPYAKLRVQGHTYDPAAGQSPYSVIVNRVSAYPSGGSHPQIGYYVKEYLAHLESIGANVINGYTSYLVGTSKAMQLDVFRQLGVRYPKAKVIHHPDQAVEASAELCFPVVVKPNIGGSGAGIVKFDSLNELELAVDAQAIDMGIDHVALVQEYLPARGNNIVRVEILDGEFLYAIRLPVVEHSFNYCPADGCHIGNSDLAVESCVPPAGVIADACRVLAAAQADLGSVEYLINEVDGKIYYYDINPLSNIVADALKIVGFDPYEVFVDYILTRCKE
jgi:predicted ATP-grasp superfamily ATP-dependent carboligase